MDVKIRERRPEDLDACVEVLAEVYELDGYPMRWPADPPAWLDPPGTVVALVGELDGAVAGHGLIRGVEGTSAAEPLVQATGRRPAELAMVSRLYVAPGGRRRGVGAKLLDALALAATAKDRVLGLDVVEKDSAAIAMYERAGWRLVATVPCDWDPGSLLRCYLAPPPDEVRASLGNPAAG